MMAEMAHSQWHREPRPRQDDVSRDCRAASFSFVRRRSARARLDEDVHIGKTWYVMILPKSHHIWVLARGVRGRGHILSYPRSGSLSSVHMYVADTRHARLLGSATMTENIEKLLEVFDSANIILAHNGIGNLTCRY